MPDRLRSLRSAPIGMISLFAVATALYVAMLVESGPPSGGGEDAFSQAWGGFLALFWLWIVLALMLIAGAVMGRMPLSGGIAALLLHPTSGVAAFVAIDAVSRHVGAGLIVLLLLPPLIAAYAFWARLPQWREAYPNASVVVWVSVGLLSLGGFAMGL